MLRSLFLFGVLLISTAVYTQHHEAVFPDLEGTQLLETVQDNFKPVSVLSYGDARDTLFGKVYMRNDSLRCVYTGHTVYLNPNADPTQTVYQNGGPNGINTEHTYPQSLGASGGNAKSDMHHLYPTRTPVNGDRNNLPFGEIPDTQTDRWYYLNQETTNIPSQNLAAYSEIKEDRFEPREDHKGNVARAMFYFYTIYRNEANAANASYFEAQRETFCSWHFQDPVDEEEWERTWQIAAHQDGKPNPFILDCSLAARLYCTEFESNCQLSSTEGIEPLLPFELQANSPNPFQEMTTINYSLEKAFQVELRLYNSLGQLLAMPIDSFQQPGSYSLNIKSSDLHLSSGGHIFGRFYISNGTEQYIVAQRMLFLP